MPAFLHADPAEGRPGQLLGGLSDAQQPPKILIAAIEDVAPDPLGDRFVMTGLPCRRERVRICYRRPVPSLKRMPPTGLIRHRLIRPDWGNLWLARG